MSCAANPDDNASAEEGNIGTVVVGIGLGVAGSFGINVGNNMQAIGLNLKAAAGNVDLNPAERLAKRRRGSFVFLVGGHAMILFAC